MSFVLIHPPPSPKYENNSNSFVYDNDMESNEKMTKDSCDIITMDRYDTHKGQL